MALSWSGAGLSWADYDKYVYSIYILLSNFSYGIYYTYYPAIQVDMKYIIGTTIALVSLQPVFETAGYTVGTFTALTYKWLSRQIVTAITFILICTLSALTPFVSHLWLLYVFALLLGFSSDINDSAYMVWNLEMWADKSGPVLLLNSLIFGLGTLVGPAIIGPHLTGVVDDEDSVTSEERRNKLVVPSIATFGSISAVALISLVMYFIKPYSKKPIIKSTDNDQNTSIKLKLFDNAITPRKRIRLLLAFWFTFYIVVEEMFFRFAITYYQYSPFRISAPESAQLFTYSTIAYSAGRLICLFLLLKLTIDTIMFIHYGILLIGMLIMIIGNFNVTALYISGPVIMLGLSPMYSGTYLFCDKYLTMTDRLSSLLQFGRSIFTLIAPFIIGEFIEKHSYVYVIVLVIHIVLAALTFIWINFYIRFYNKMLATEIVNLDEVQ